MTDICRLCASLKILDQLTSMQEPNLRIGEKLARCCSVELSPDELMPQSICHECIVSIDSSWNFAEKVCQAQDILKKAFIIRTAPIDEPDEPGNSFNGTISRHKVASPASVNDLSLKVRSMIISLHTKGYGTSEIGQKLNINMNLADQWIRMYEDQRKPINAIVMNESGSEIELSNEKTDILIGTGNEDIEIHSENDTDASTIIEIVDYKLDSTERPVVDSVAETISSVADTTETQSNSDNVYGDHHDNSDESNSNFEYGEILGAVELNDDDKNDDGSISQRAVEKLKIESWNDYPWKCMDCDLLMADIRDLRQHHITNHQSTSKYSCVDCPKVFNKYATFLAHVRNRHRSHLKFCCDICSVFFWNSRSMHQHRYEHDKDRAYLCQTCGKGFRCNSTLQVHCRSHLPVDLKNRYNCDICFKKFGTKPNLQAHKRIHSGVRDFTCEQCGRGFVQKGNLENHMLTHFPSKPFSCHCGKTFKTQLRLLKHKTVHTDFKPHKCQDCGKEFREKGTLKEHERIHLGLMPFTCEFCGKKFRFKGVLTTHRRQHTGERPYSCIECNHHFTNWPNYNKHMKRRHGINTSVTVRKPQLIPPSGIPPTKLNHVVPTVHNTAYVQATSIPTTDSRNGHIANTDMMETICEKDIICVNQNGFATATASENVAAATVQGVNVIVNRSERKATSNQSAPQITILTQPARDNINQQYSYLPNGSTMLGFYNIHGVDLMQNANVQQ
ncbi:hypothetical protein HA402_012884 [Bradysia odoriphaga]|nr:hypothetical protein HA402_012884 [Bradysia odoriphaga]